MSYAESKKKIDAIRQEYGCKDLQEQLGDKYVVLMPTDTYTCIQIFRYDFPYLADKLKERDCIDIRKV